MERFKKKEQEVLSLEHDLLEEARQRKAREEEQKRLETEKKREQIRRKLELMREERER